MAGDSVGDVIAGTDQDAGDSLTYSIIGGNEEGVFEIESSTGQIQIASSYDTSAGYLDYERSIHPENWNLTIQVTDNGGADGQFGECVRTYVCMGECRPTPRCYLRTIHHTTP